MRARGFGCHRLADWASRRMRAAPTSVDDVAMSSDTVLPDTIVLVHGFWVTPRSWEHWITHYEQRASRSSRRRTRASRSRSKRSTPIRPSIAEVTAPAIISHFEDGDRRARLAADHHRPLGRRRVHPGAARPRLRRGRCRAQLGADRGRQGDAAVAGQVDVPGAQEPGQPAPGRPDRRSTSGTTPSPTRSPGRSPTRCTSATPSRRPGGILWDSVLANLDAGPPGGVGRLPATTTAHRCCSSPAARTTSCRRRCSGRTPSTTSRSKTVTEIKRVRGVRPPAAGPGGLGGDRRFRPRLGARPDQRQPGGRGRGDRRPRRRVDRRLQRTATTAT